MHKSGTTLVRSLFDGHKDCIVIPFETHFFQNAGFWVSNEHRKSEPKELPLKEKVAQLIKQVKFYNSNSNIYADVVLKGQLDVEGFTRQITSAVDKGRDLTDRELLIEYLYSVSRIVDPRIQSYSDFEQHKVVEKSIENAEYALLLKKWFPDARFIHVIRNPYSNLVSLRKFRVKSSGHYPLLDKAIKSFLINYKFLYLNKSIIRDDYFVLKYEELLENPIDMAKSLAEFTELDWDECLLTPSNRGIPWKGNSTNNTNYDQISSIYMDKWKKEISPNEIKSVNRYLLFTFKQFNYKKLEIKKGLYLIPSRKESVKKYIANRMFYYYL